VVGRIVCVGEVMLDVLAEPWRPGARHGRAVVRAGGTPVNAALAAVDAGARATVVGRVGRDTAAVAIRAELSRAGVETSLAVDADHATGTYVEAGDVVVASRGANAYFVPRDVPELAADAVLVSGYALAHRDSRRAAERALDLDVPWRAVTAIPTGPYDLPVRANVLFATEQEADRLPISRFEIVVLTRAEEGAYVLRGGTTEYVPPTGRHGVGAGDALAGTFLAGL
jgi:sugar/nucleoside kinase (ribokinase family)